MKISLFALAALLAVTPPSKLSAQDGKATLSIAKVATTAALSNSLATSTSVLIGPILESLDNQLLMAISSTRKFQIVALKDLNEVLNKQDLAASGNYDPRGSKQSGKLQAAKYIVMAEVDQFNESFRHLEARLPNEKSSQLGKRNPDPIAKTPTALERTLTIHVVVKIYDTASGRLFEAAEVSRQKTELQLGSTETITARENADGSTRGKNYVPIPGWRIKSLGSSEPKTELRFEARDLSKITDAGDALLRELTKETAEAVALRIADRVFPIKVLSKRERLVTLNRGEGGGVVAGQVYDVYSVGEELLDEDTWEVLGHEGVPIGKARIIAVHPMTSIAELVEDRGVQKGSILRPPLVVDHGERTSATAKRTVLFGFIKWGDHVYAEGLGPQGKDELSKTMRAAAYKAMTNGSAITLENPTYVISKRNFLIFQRYKVEATGFGRRGGQGQDGPSAFNSTDPTRDAQLQTESTARREQERLAAEVAAAEAKARAREEEMKQKQAALAVMAEVRTRRELEIEVAAAKAQADAKIREAEMKQKQAALSAAMAAMAAEEEAKLRREQERKAIDAVMAEAETKLRQEERLASEAVKAAEAEAKLQRERERTAAMEAEARRRDEERRTAAALQAQQEELAREQARQRAIAEQEAAKARAAAGLSGVGKPLTQSQIQRLANLYTSYTNDQISFGKYQRERTKIINE